MAIRSARCPVLRATVTLVTDLEGQVTRIICPQYQDPTGQCKLKVLAHAGGPLSELLARVSEDTLQTRTTRCDRGPH